MHAFALEGRTPRRASKLTLKAILTAALTLAMAAFIPGASPLAAAVTVSVSPAPAFTVVGFTVPFTATVSGTTTTSVTWYVDGVAGGNATVGTLTGTGASATYKAPTATGTHTVKAISAADTTVSASTTVTVQPMFQVSLTPGASAVTGASTLAFLAGVTGHESAALAWTVDGIAGGNATVGTIVKTTGAGATYTAPAAAGTHTVTVAGTKTYGTKTASSVVTVQTTGFTVTLTPANPTLGTYGSVTCYAAVSGNEGATLTWKVDGITNGNATVGTLLKTTGAYAAYKAPATGGSHTLAVSATNTQGTRTASTTVTVVAKVVATVTPSSAILNTGSTQSLTATVVGAPSTSVTWTVDGVTGGNATVGTLTGTGNTVTYKAPATPGTHAVVAASVSSPATTATATMSVLNPAAVTMTPASAKLAASGTVSLTATVTGSTNTAVTWKVDGVANGNTSVGTLTGTGNTVTYKAPAAVGLHTVVATSAANTLASASCALTVQNTVVVTLPVPLVKPTNLNESGSALVRATVAGTANTAVTWSVDGVANGNSATGTILNPASTNTVIYTAPATAGTHTVTATSVVDTTKSASATFTVASTTTVIAAPGTTVNVRNAPYNAKGDGVTDDTAAIQAAINAIAGTGGSVTVPAGTYLINPIVNNNAGLRVGSNMTLNLQSGAILKAKATSTSNYVVVLFSGVSNANLLGGTIVGNRNNNTITDTAEAGMGVEIAGSQNIVVEGVTAQDCWSDGFYICNNAQNVTLCNDVATNDRRNCLSVVWGSYLTIRGCTFKAATGMIESGAWTCGNGLDIEPNPGNTISTVLISGSTFANNLEMGVGSGVPGSNTGVSFVDNIFIDHNTFTANGDRGIDISNCSSTTVSRNLCQSNKNYGILFHVQANGNVCTGNTVTGTTGAPGHGIAQDTCSGNVITGNTSTGNAGAGVYTVACAGGTVSGNTQSGNGIAP